MKSSFKLINYLGQQSLGVEIQKRYELSGVVPFWVVILKLVDSHRLILYISYLTLNIYMYLPILLEPFRAKSHNE